MSNTLNDSEYRTIRELGYSNNKEVIFKKVNSIYIEKFRSIENKQMDLGEHLTVISGKNGTMKSTILGLLAHPFSSPNSAKDHFGNNLKTTMSDVFRFSKKHDLEDYSFKILLESDRDELISESCRVYFSNSDQRHRITVSGNSAGQGNLSLNTAFLNLKRLYPIAHTKAAENSSIQFDEKEANIISKAYENIMSRTAFNQTLAIEEKGIKSTFGPQNSNYDFESISSGEDNLGHILTKVIALEKNAPYKNKLNGLLCIDEFEAGLHPVVQVKLFDFLYSWAKNNNIQVVITTHSLYLLSHILELQSKSKLHNSLTLNIISTAFTKNNNYNILKNPTYNDAYKELTFKEFNNIEKIHKINIICEDDMAKIMIERIIKKTEIKKHLNFITNLSGNKAERGNSYTTLANICEKGTVLLENSIVIFDADVADQVFNKIKNFKSYLRLPDQNKFPIEKAIVYFILKLEGDHKFFKDFNKEKDAFLNEFATYSIPLNPDNITNSKNIPIRAFKNWVSNNESDFKKYLTYYINSMSSEDIFISFRDDLISLINNILISKSLPKINN